jgi:leucyl/phenylalanyl-tRNA--protein transferase
VRWALHSAIDGRGAAGGIVRRPVIFVCAAKIHIIDPEDLMNAYCKGYFPMADGKEGDIGWYSPDPRGIFDLNEFQISRSLCRTVRKKVFDIRIDTDFHSVIRSCSERPETWISETIIQSYQKLFQLGLAHSVEAWQDGLLAGGLYGVALGGVFFGESMFSRKSDASKAALVFLVNRLRERGYCLLDTQYTTPHLISFGAKEISREQYLECLKQALQVECSFIERL